MEPDISAVSWQGKAWAKFDPCSRLMKMLLVEAMNQ
jgi:hypothetical protein